MTDPTARGVPHFDGRRFALIHQRISPSIVIPSGYELRLDAQYESIHPDNPHRHLVSLTVTAAPVELGLGHRAERAADGIVESVGRLAVVGLEQVDRVLNAVTKGDRLETAAGNALGSATGIALVALELTEAALGRINKTATAIAGRLLR